MTSYGEFIPMYNLKTSFIILIYLYKKWDKQHHLMLNAYSRLWTSAAFEEYVSGLIIHNGEFGSTT